MASKFYVVWHGRQPGIYTTWADCKKQVDKFTGARFKSYLTQEEAEQAFGGKLKTKTKPKPKASAPGNKSRASQSVTQAEIDAIKVDVKIFSDGACSKNPGEAGTGLSIYRDGKISELWFGLYNPQGTNNTAELNGLYHAMLIAQEELAAGRTVALFSDSSYSIQAITKWAKGWKAKGWKRADGPVKNLDLIKPMFELYEQLTLATGKLPIHHCRGHMGIEGNELADRMALKAIAEQEEDLARYPDKIDVQAILATAADQ